MSYGGYRRNDLAYGDDYGGERWDRDRFERIKPRVRSPPEREAPQYVEPRGGDRRAIYIDERIERREAGGRYEERDRFYEEDRAPPRRRPEYLDEDPRKGRGEIAPYRQAKWSAAEYDIPIRAPARPTIRRRQSSLDTYDRRPVPRYDDDERAPPPPTKYREVIRYRDEPEENYREVRIRRERSVRPIRVEESSDSFEEISPPSPPQRALKRGKTRFPKRLTERRAIIDFAYPFEEEEDFYFVRVALTKDQIDEVISRSERYREIALPKQLEAPPPPEPEVVMFYPPPIEPLPEDLIEVTRTTKIIENPTPSEIERLGKERESSGSSSSSSESEGEKSKRTRARSRRSRRRVIVVEDENSIGGPLTVVAPERRRKSARDIESEIRRLEAEKKALKLEREADQRRAKAERIREAEYEVVDSRRDRNVVRVEKDRRGKSRSRIAPSGRTLDAALFTLT